MKDITENLIYETYKCVIQQDHSGSFLNFTQEHRDSYMRLKLRGLNYQNPHIIPPNSIESVNELPLSHNLLQSFEKQLKIAQSFQEDFSLTIKTENLNYKSLLDKMNHLNSDIDA